MYTENENYIYLCDRFPSESPSCRDNRGSAHAELLRHWLNKRSGRVAGIMT